MTLWIFCIWSSVKTTMRLGQNCPWQFKGFSWNLMLGGSCFSAALAYSKAELIGLGGLRTSWRYMQLRTLPSHSDQERVETKPQSRSKHLDSTCRHPSLFHIPWLVAASEIEGLNFRSSIHDLMHTQSLRTFPILRHQHWLWMDFDWFFLWSLEDKILGSRHPAAKRSILKL